MANLILDTGPLVALLNRDETAHGSCVDFLKAFRGKLLSTEPILTEALYLLADSFSHQKKCLEFVLSAVQVIPSSVESLKHSLELMEKYKNLPMDYADATLVSLAEEIQCGQIFTLDRRDFAVYRIKRGHRNLALQVIP